MKSRSRSGNQWCVSTRNPWSYVRTFVERFGVEAGDWLWDRFTVHYTPNPGSWLNQAEIAISRLATSLAANYAVTVLGDNFSVIASILNGNNFEVLLQQ